MPKSRADVLRGQIAALADELATLESRPAEPPAGSVIKFDMFYPDSISRRYTYAAINAGGRWYVTGTGPQRVTWDALLDWMIGKATRFEILQANGQFQVDL